MAANRLSCRDSEKTIDILYGADKWVMAWHLYKTGQMHIKPDSYRAIGITLDDKLIASVLYTRYKWPDIEIGINTIDKRWCNRRTLRHIFSYPFNQLQCRRVTAVTDPATPAVCSFLNRIGFTQEGRLRHATPDGDLLILGMTRDECRWIT